MEELLRSSFSSVLSPLLGKKFRVANGSTADYTDKHTLSVWVLIFLMKYHTRFITQSLAVKSTKQNPPLLIKDS